MKGCRGGLGPEGGLWRSKSLTLETNKNQEKNIAELNVALLNLQQRIEEEKNINQKQQENIEKSSKEILNLKTELSKVETIKTIS